MITLKKWFVQAKNRLNNANILNAEQDIKIIINYGINVTNTHLLAFGDKKITEKQYKKLEFLLLRRLKGEPISFIVNECEFWSLPLKVSNATIIPRQETECLVRYVLEVYSYHDTINVLDLGTGSGAIALAIATERPKWKILGIDRSKNAIKIAKQNAFILKIKNVTFMQGNWFNNLKKNFYNVIVSNPPYIEQNDFHTEVGDLRYEPYSALISGKDGLRDLSLIIRNANLYLSIGGWLFVEHGWKQGKKVKKIFLKYGFNNVKTLLDYEKKERVTKGKWIGK